MAAIVRLEPDTTTWTLHPAGTPVHLVALFRDPGIVDGRVVSTVLDLRARRDGRLTAGKSCWVGAFLRALEGIPPGITIALDNGVRCSCAKEQGLPEFRRRAASCHAATEAWYVGLRHPDGMPPGIVICDKDLAESLADLRVLHRRDGSAWRCPLRFLDSVGEEVRYLGVESLILAHPSVVQRKPAYFKAFVARNIASRVGELARIDRAAGE